MVVQQLSQRDRYTCHDRIYRAYYCNSHFRCLYLLFCFSGTTAKHPLMAQAMVLSQKFYRSLWNKWEIFLHKYFPPVWTDIQYTIIDYTTLLDRLLMFVTYLAHELRCNVRSITSKMSALRHGMVSRLVRCCNVFDND
jgi:hypothetical protein